LKENICDNLKLISTRIFWLGKYVIEAVSENSSTLEHEKRKRFKLRKRSAISEQQLQFILNPGN